MRGRGALEAEDACREASKDVTRRAMNLNDRNAELERRTLELCNLKSMEDCIGDEGQGPSKRPRHEGEEEANTEEEQ